MTVISRSTHEAILEQLIYRILNSITLGATKRIYADRTAIDYGGFVEHF